MRRIRQFLLRDLCALIAQPIRHAPDVVTQDLAFRTVRQNRRAAREIGEKRPQAQVARIGSTRQAGVPKAAP